MAKPMERKYYGCIHCKSLAVKRLSTCSGDPEGIREDSECLVCGGVFGCCKSSFTTIHESEWEGDEPMPRPNRNKIDAMQILIALEEQFNFRFRSREVAAAQVVTDLIKEQRGAMLRRNQSLTTRLEEVRKVVR